MPTVATVAGLPLFGGEIQDPPHDVKLNDNDIWVKRVQEWLCFAGINVGIDGGQAHGGFGPATEAGVKRFQGNRNLAQTGVVELVTWSEMVRPLLNAVSFAPAGATSIGDAVVKVAEAHLGPHPVEVGGDNRGPWVRTYCKGRDGPAFEWCQGFASSMVEQASVAMNAQPPVPLFYTPGGKPDLNGIFSLFVPCVAEGARSVGRLVRGTDPNVSQRVTPGSFFFVKGGSAGYSHVGIVTRMDGNVFHTIEGNTNNENSARGYEVCASIRRTVGCDFGVI